MKFFPSTKLSKRWKGCRSSSVDLMTTLDDKKLWLYCWDLSRSVFTRLRVWGLVFWLPGRLNSTILLGLGGQILLPMRANQMCSLICSTAFSSLSRCLVRSLAMSSANTLLIFHSISSLLDPWVNWFLKIAWCSDLQWKEYNRRQELKFGDIGCQTLTWENRTSHIWWPDMQYVFIGFFFLS